VYSSVVVEACPSIDKLESRFQKFAKRREVQVEASQPILNSTDKGGKLIY